MPATPLTLEQRFRLRKGEQTATLELLFRVPGIDDGARLDARIKRLKCLELPMGSDVVKPLLEPLGHHRPPLGKGDAGNHAPGFRDVEAARLLDFRQFAEQAAPGRGKVELFFCYARGGETSLCAVANKNKEYSCETDSDDGCCV